MADRGVAGLDALIIFIAIILAASVIALSLINTSQTFVRRDQAVQAEKTKGIQKPIVLDQMRAYDSNGDRRLDRLYWVMRLRNGDEPVRFNETVIIARSEAVNCTSLSYGQDADPLCAFTVSYSKSGPDFQQDYLNNGDMVELGFSGQNIVPGIEESEAQFTFIPSHGLSSELKANIPERIMPANMQLWPIKDRS
jgi:flagellin-like protein